MKIRANNEILTEIERRLHLEGKGESLHDLFEIKDDRTLRQWRETDRHLTISKLASVCKSRHWDMHELVFGEPTEELRKLRTLDTLLTEAQTLVCMLKDVK